MIGDNYNILNSGNNAPSGFGSQYDRLFSNNPYRNLEYKKSTWQNFLSSLGFRTDADRWLEDAQVNAAEYDAGIYSMMYQNEYNDPASQAARMRDAGLNPDLLGTGDVAPAASPAEDPNGMSQNATDTEQIASFGRMVYSALTAGLSFAKDLGSLAQLRNIVDTGDIERGSALSDFITKSILSHTPARGFNSNEELNNWASGISDIIFNDASALGFSKRSLKALKRQIGFTIGSIPTELEQYKQWNERLKQGREYRIGQGDHWTEDLDLIGSVVEPLREAASTIRELYANVEIETQSNELEFQQGIDIGAETAAYNQSNEEVRSRKAVSDVLNSALEKVMNNLERDAKQGGFKGAKAEAILLIMSLLQMQMIPSPSFSRNKSSFSGPKGSGSSSGFSFGLGF